MRVVQARWIFVAVLAMAWTSGVRSQEDGGEDQPSPDPGTRPDNASPSPTAPGPGDRTTETPAPSPADTPSSAATSSPETTPAPATTPSPATTLTPGTTLSPGTTPAPADDSVDCIGGIQGATGDGVPVCCASTCGNTCNDDGCDEGDDECCPSAIANLEVFCDDEEPPCIVSTDADDEDDNSGDSDSGDSDSDTSTGVIALAVVLAALLLGNAICCCMFKRRKKLPTPSPTPVSTRSAADAEMGRQQSANASAEIRRLQEELTSERNRRQKAESIIQHDKGGGIRPGDFPSVRDVDLDLENLAGHAITWAEQACAVDGGAPHPALPATVRSVLENTFLVCRQEVKRCFDERLQSLSGFLGNDEPVELSGGDSMNLDTQYVLYECLRRNYRTIVPTEPDRVRELASAVQESCEEGSGEDDNLAGDIIFGDEAWPSFDNLVKKFIMVFVEMALQKPAMEFQDDLGESRAFDPVVHRDWAPHLDAPTGQCCIVFPAILPQEGRPKSNAKTGVVRLPA